MLARLFVVFFDTIDLLGPIVYVILRDTYSHLSNKRGAYAYQF